MRNQPDRAHKDEIFPCTLCGGSSYVLVYTKGHWKYHRCRVCGLVSLYPRPSNEAILKSYDAYLPVAQHEVECWAEMIKPVVDYSADLINRRNISEGRRLLDIGCGYGFFLKKIERYGWRVEGIEVSLPGREYAANKLGLRIHSQPLEKISFPEKRFDAVTLFYVIEHVNDPKSLLNEVHRILKPGGMVLLRWPHSAPVVKILGPFAKRYDVFHTPYHLYDFNPETMTRLLQQTGFRTVETMIGSHTCPKRTFYRWSSVFFGTLAEMLYRISAGRLLLPGVSKTTLAIK